MKLRVIEMNGQRIVEAYEDGIWKIQEVSKTRKLRPGIYKLYQSEQADKTKSYDGIIVHSTDEYIYQQTEDLIINHVRSDFYQRLPEIGTLESIVYNVQGKVVLKSL